MVFIESSLRTCERLGKELKAALTSRLQRSSKGSLRDFDRSFEWPLQAFEGPLKGV